MSQLGWWDELMEEMTTDKICVPKFPYFYLKVKTPIFTSKPSIFFNSIIKAILLRYNKFVDISQT